MKSPNDDGDDDDGSSGGGDGCVPKHGLKLP